MSVTASPARSSRNAWFDTPNAEAIIAAQAGVPVGARDPLETGNRVIARQDDPRRARHDAGRQWLRGFALLDKYKLSWDLRVPFWHLEKQRRGSRVSEARRSSSTTPGSVGSQRGRARAWRRGMAALACEPNVWVKVSEFG